MSFMLVTLCWVALILGVVSLIAPTSILSKILPSVFVQNKKRILIPVLTIAVIITQLNSIFFYSEAGYSYLVQYATGRQTAVLSPGWKLKLYGEVTPFKKVMTVRFTKKDIQASGRDLPIAIRFNDAVTADVSLAVRFRLPEDAETFKTMAVEFRSQTNLVANALMPTIREVVRNSGRMMSAQAYISGKGGEFEQAVQSQLESGIYILGTREINTTDSTQQITNNSDRTVNNRRTVRYEVYIKEDKDKNPIRKIHPLKQYNIFIAQTAVENVDPEKKFKEMLGKQRDAAADASVEKQMAQKAEYKKQRIIAEGETQKAEIRVSKEKEQIETLINAETQLKEAEIREKTEKAGLEADRLKAKRIEVIAAAEANKKRKIMLADGALDKKLATFEKVHANYAEAIKGSQIVPSVVIGGDSKSGGKNATDLVNLLTAKTAMDLGLKLNPGK